MTAVEWLIDQLFELRNPTLNQIEILKQAKEMEKQQQGYSEEEVLKLLINFSDDRTFLKKDIAVKWFEQFSKLKKV